jgi:hypothetical protein
MLLGQFTEAEVRSAAGPADAVVKAKGTVYVFEFKPDGTGTAEEAVKQIEERGYHVPYKAGVRDPVKVGVVFDTEKRTLKDWFVYRPNG